VLKTSFLGSFGDGTFALILYCGRFSRKTFHVEHLSQNVFYVEQLLCLARGVDYALHRSPVKNSSCSLGVEVVNLPLKLRICVG